MTLASRQAEDSDKTGRQPRCTGLSLAIQMPLSVAERSESESRLIACALLENGSPLMLGVVDSDRVQTVDVRFVGP